MKTVIIAAAGSGSRFGSKKQFEYLNNKLVIDYSVEFFGGLGFKIVIATQKEDMDFIQNRYSYALVVEGASERFFSVYNGLKMVHSNFVLIHDAARPILSKDKVLELLETVYVKNAAILAVKCTDTLKYVEDNNIKFTVNREHLYCAQTPQAFNVKLLKKAYELAIKDNLTFTDEASLFEHYISSVAIVEGSRYNIKITTKEDLKLARCILNVNDIIL